MDALVLHRSHPYRPPDWRWQRATNIKEGKSKLHKTRDDKMILEATKFQTALSKCRDDEARFKLFDEMRDIYLAYELRDEKRELEDTYSAGRSHPCRYEIEARLLAAESYESIASKVFATTAAIELFAALFFDVADRLTSSSYVINTVLGPQVHRGLTEKNYDIIWKLFGYWWGPQAIDSLITKFSTGKQQVTAASINSLWKQFTRDSLTMKSGLASLLMPVNTFNQLQILETDARYKEVEIATESVSNVESGIVMNISEMLHLLPWINRKNDPKILPIYDTAVEPRAFDVLSEDRAKTEDVKFPEPTNIRFTVGKPGGGP